MSTNIKIALQLYTVRGECARDLEGTLRRVAALGYDGVELYDLNGHTPEQVRAWLDELDLVAAGRHAGLEALETARPELADELRVLGTDRIAVSWVDPPQTMDQARGLTARIEAVAERARELDLELGFHNHWGELAPLDGGATMFDLLVALPADLLWLELDLGWAWEAGTDPVELLERTAGRSPLVHIKDLRTHGREGHCPVGDGAVGYDRVVPAAVRAGAEWLVVEQDEIDGPPFDAVERSLQAVQRFLPVAA